MFAKIAAFELRYQARNPVFWVVAILFFLLTFGLTASENVSIGVSTNIHKNAPAAILQAYEIFSLFFMFVTTAFVANVIVRDDESGFGSMVRSTRVSKLDYLLGRFVGAYLIAAIAFLVVPLGIFIGTLMPWLDSELIGPNKLVYYLQPYLIFALPNLFLTAAIFFAVATTTRSMIYSYIGVIVFFVLWSALSITLSRQPEWREFAGYVEPFGLAAIANVARYWTAAESNTRVVDLTRALVANRAIWLSVGVVALLFAYARFSFTEAGASLRKVRRQARKAAKLAMVAPVTVDRLPPTRPEAAAWTRLSRRCRFEMALVFRSPAFLVIVVIGLFNAVLSLVLGNPLYGTPSRPLTFLNIETLNGAFTFFSLIIAIYYSGELVWRDRERKMHEIIDATALPNWAYMVPKTLAVALVLFATIAIAVLASIIVQLARGQTDLALGSYVLWYLLPSAVDLIILAVLAVFVQAISPNKFVGWAIMVVYIVATITLGNLGYDHPLYLYGSTGTVPLSDMNGDHVGGAASWWLRLYWGAFALMLAVLAHLLWRRGTETRLAPRLRRLPARLASPAGAVLAVGALTAAASGGFLYYNMNVLNTYRNVDSVEARLAEYEKKFLKYQAVVQPTITDMTLAVALYPDQHRAVTTGTYRFTNQTSQPITTLHVRLADQQTKLMSVDIPGATLVSNDLPFQYRIYRFATPLAPGAKGSLTFKSLREQNGMRANGNDTRLVDNGTFLDNAEITPQIGMDRTGLLQDPVKRRRYGLPSELRLPKLEDTRAQARNYIGNAPWVRSDITVSTVADQTPIAPGAKVSDTVANGRRTARFVANNPILAFFSVQSAAYAVKTADGGGGVTLSVYYDPKHPYNVDRMLKAMRLSLDYYRANFGPYQFPYARIIEFPGYATFAQSFAGTIPYSERIGFIANNADADKIDFVTYVTAHELGHQYWAHQLISAEMQGGTMLVETMAQYSALMVMKHLYGEDKIRRFLKYELDSYLRARGGERVEELPLERVEDQGYIHYRKGAVVLYLLQDRLGEARVNAMLARLLDKYRFKGAPYARSTDLVDGFLALARTPEERALVGDLLQRITVYDLKAKSAVTKQLPDGSYETAITVAATKFYASGKGVEKEAPLSDHIDIGLFSQRPGLGAFAASDVISMAREPVASGEQVIRVRSKRKPGFAGIDPYNKYVDRNSDDNLAAVTTG